MHLKDLYSFNINKNFKKDEHRKNKYFRCMYPYKCITYSFSLTTF